MWCSQSITQLVGSHLSDARAELQSAPLSSHCLLCVPCVYTPPPLSLIWALVTGCTLNPIISTSKSLTVSPKARFPVRSQSQLWRFETGACLFFWGVGARGHLAIQGALKMATYKIVICKLRDKVIPNNILIMRGTNLKKRLAWTLNNDIWVMKNLSGENHWRSWLLETEKEFFSSIYRLDKFT